MIKLKENKLIENGTCRYEDCHGNRYFLKRTDNGFKIKARSKDKNVRTETIQISLPVDCTGVNIHFDFLDGIDRTEEEHMQELIQNTGELIHRWINLCQDINLLNQKPDLLGEMTEDVKEEISKRKLQVLSEYAELDYIRSIL